MPFEKKQSGNPSGRPKGVKNKVDVDLRALVNKFLIGKFPEVLKKWEGLSDKDQLKFYRELMQYGLPKLQSVDLYADLDNTLNSMTEGDLDALAEKITGKNG